MQRSIYKYYGIMNRNILLFVLTSSVMETYLNNIPFCSKNHMTILYPCRVFLFVVSCEFISSVYLVSWVVFSVGWRSLPRIPAPFIFKGTGLKLSTIGSDYRFPPYFLLSLPDPNWNYKNHEKNKQRLLVIGFSFSYWQVN